MVILSYGANMILTRLHRPCWYTDLSFRNNDSNL